MKPEERNTAILVIIVLIVCTISLIALGRIVWNIAAKPLWDVTSRTFTALQIKKDNYNFTLPAKVEEPLNVISNKPNNNPNYFEQINYFKTGMQTVFVEPIILVNNPPQSPQPVPQPTPTPTPTPPKDSGGKDEDKDKVDDYVVLADDKQFNYNFTLPKKTVKPTENIDYKSFESAIVDDALLAVKDETAFVNRGNLSISIPKINVDSSVYQGLNANELLNKGFWLHPGSFTLGEGEVVVLCHRRYFGPYDPRSCWFLDKVTVGDEINVKYNTDNLKYQVVGVQIFDGEDPLIYKINKDSDYIKIVTCTPLYSNAQRLVVLAKRVS